MKLANFSNDKEHIKHLNRFEKEVFIEYEVYLTK